MRTRKPPAGPFVVVLVLSSLLCTGARADDVSAAMSDTVNDLYIQADAARGEKQWDVCHAKATAAWALQKHPKIAAVRGDCALALNRHREAGEYLSYFLERRGPNENPELVTYVEGRFAEARTKIGVVRVEVNVEPAEVRIDEAPIDPSLPVCLEPGPHELVTEREGYEPFTRSFTVAAGQRQDLDVQLTPLTSDVPDDKKDEAFLLWPLMIGTGVIAVGGIVVGAVGLVAAGGADDEASAAAERIGAAENACSSAGSTSADCVALSDAIDDRDFFTNMGITGFIVGGVGVVATAVLLIVELTPGDGATVSLHVAPTLTGAVVGGTF